MTNDSGNIIEKIAKGTTDAVLEKSGQAIKNFAIGFKKRKIRFLEDPITINSVLIEKKSSEMPLYKTYLNLKNGSDLYYQILMGLTLRRLEVGDNSKKVSQLRNKVLIKYGLSGLYVAQLVQCGGLKMLINHLNSKCDLETIKNKLESFISEIEKNVYFVKSGDKVEEVVEDINMKLTSNSPEFFAFAGFSSAMEAVKETYSFFESSPEKKYSLMGHFNDQSILGFFARKI